MGYLQFSDGSYFHVSDEPGAWPDGVLVHGHNVFVKLGCGHHRVATGWRGSAGEGYCCDVCKTMTTILATLVTADEPYDWREPTKPAREAPRMPGF